VPNRQSGNITWRTGLLPALVIAAAVVFQISLATSQDASNDAAHSAGVAVPVPRSVAVPDPAPRGPIFRAPAGLAVQESWLYISDVPTDAIWAHDLRSGAETVIAGSLGAGYSGDGGPALQSQLTEPRGLALDAAGSLYVADSGNHAIRKIDRSGTITTVAGNGTRGFSGDGGPAINSQLNTPTGVAFDAAGNLYIADTLNNRVRKVNTAGTISTIAGSGVWSVVGGTGGFGFSGDGGPAVDAQLSIPEGVAVSPDGSVYIADTGNDRIRRVDANQVIETVSGTGRYNYSGNGGPAVLADLYAPVGLASGPAGVYFSERANHAIRLIEAGGKMVAIAGGGGVRGSQGDGGPAVAAKLSDPQGIALGPDGALYVADAGNHLVRVITAGSLTIKAV
jgi:sugar lactone lactonase YvrE